MCGEVQSPFVRHQSYVGHFKALRNEKLRIPLTRKRVRASSGKIYFFSVKWTILSERKKQLAVKQVRFECKEFLICCAIKEVVRG